MARPKRIVLEYRNYELPADFPILILTGDRWHISPVPGKHLHFHNCLEIGLCHSGSGTMVFDRQESRFSAGDVTCIARNVPHTTWSDPDSKSLWSYIFLDAEALLGPALFGGNTGLHNRKSFFSECHLILPEKDRPQISVLFRQIISEMTEKQLGYRSCVRGLCMALLAYLLRVYNEDSSTETRDMYIHSISPALDFIHEQYMTTFPQDELAALCHLSPTHFRRLFREQMGTSPLSFLHQTRILKSCSLLRSSEMSIAEISGRIGYNSISSYNRHFLSAMGCTPNQWRKASDGDLRPSLLTYSGWTEAEK